LALDVTPEALERFLSGEGGPVVLVNLVKVRPGGVAAYERYREAVGLLAARVGAEVIYAGTAAGTLIGERDWDPGHVVRYPSRQAVADLVRAPEFEALASLRHEALEGGILHAFT
jgi:uncharacterized protein (DUF1330 family)